MEHLLENALRHRIRVDFKHLSSTHGGFATGAAEGSGDKMRIVIHEALSPPSSFGVLCHEMAHILLGHLGSDEDQWWPSRSHLGRATVEIEAEATAFVVTQRLGLEGSSAAYVSSYLKPDGQVPASVSFDMIATVAADIKKMAEGKEPTPLTKAERARRRAQ
jgi:antirestriction protein ArdC